MVQAELGGDGQKFPGPMGAGVAGADGFQAMRNQRGAQGRVMRKVAQMGGHFCAVTREQEVLAGAEQGLAVGPRGRDKGDAAGQRLEDADGRDAGQHRHVEAARHVHGGEMLGEDVGRAGVGEPTVIGNAVALQGGERLGGVAHAVNVERELSFGGGAEEKLTGIALDERRGRLWAAGYTKSSDFPAQNAVQPALAGPMDAFLTQFSLPDLKIVSSTYYGGSGEDSAWGVALLAARWDLDARGCQLPSQDEGSCPGAKKALRMLS